MTLSQDNIGSTTVHRGDVVPVAGGSTETVFDVSDPVDIISGHIHGYLQDTVRVTWSDGSTDEIYPNARVSAETQGNDIFSISVLPPVEDVTELTFVNDSGAVFDYSYYVLTI